MPATISKNRLAGKRIRVAIDAKANADEIAGILKRLYGISGCTDCGRGGYDILLTHSLPELESFKVERLQGVVAEEMGARF